MIGKTRAAVLTTVASSAFALTALATTASASGIQVTVENLTTSDGFFLTPLWVGFHDGSFDSYDMDATATAGLERLAEDGVTSFLSEEFAAITTRGAGGIDSVIANGGPIAPGTSATAMFTDLDVSSNKFFSYVSMVIPSNDAFIANGNPTAYQLFDAAGNFAGPITIDIFGSDVLDAGTEVNDEQGVAFLTGTGGQTGPDQGLSESNTVGTHGGLLADGNILGGSTAAGTVFGNDIIGSDQLLARITITQLPEPSSLALLGLAAMPLMARRRNKVRS
ncbi:spondin domain-containing protein [Planctomycetota bacterium]|nr:spondin domain-containing protein [Planctomycetota bacterium]